MVAGGRVMTDRQRIDTVKRLQLLMSCIQSRAAS